MDTERPHFRTSTTTTTSAATSTELFISLTSRRPSMKLSKSLLSPGRAARDGPPSLSSSLSRRLRPNGSLKSGHASPFFPTPGGGKKRGCGFDNPEPSSPKVTCIGQVRVKSKKKKKKKQPLPSRSLSRRRSGGGGDLSFRKIDPPPPQEGVPQHRNQRWVHLPISICEALRSFGAEFSCLFPCRSSCSNEEREKSEKRSEHGCGAVLARWLVAEREIELVVGDGDDDNNNNDDEEGEERRVSIRASRRHVFEDFEVKDDRIEETAAVGICIPPPNALLLMRCRSDPMKMAALANRFNDLDAGDNENSEMNLVGDVEVEEIKEQVLELEEKGDELEEGGVGEEEEVESNMSSFEALLDQETAEQSDDCCCTGQVEESPLSALTEPNEEVQNSEEENKEHEEAEFSAVIKDDGDEEHEETEFSVVIKENDEEKEHEETESSVVLKEEEEEEEEEKEAEKKEKNGPLLPECLLLMMCEPKLSMEVSRETWVCTTDFAKWLPERPRRAAKEPVIKRRLSVDSKAKPIAEPQPPRSSCSLPAAAAMASMIERKLAACEPFVLTRCKSEPMRTAAGKLAPESCFWKNAVRKLEPHAMGVGAAGVGF